MNEIIVNDVRPLVQSIADGVQTEFFFPFVIFEDTDLDVYLGDVEQLSGFSVMGAHTNDGGSIIFETPPANGTIVTMRRRLVIKRTTDFAEGGEFLASVLNEELDRQTAILQQLDQEAVLSVKRAATSASDADLTLPEPLAGRVLKWKSDLSGFENSQNDPDAVALAAQSSAALAEAAKTAAEAARDATLNAFDTFDDRYLGNKDVDPILDNDGNPLVAGQLYFNTLEGAMKVFTGTQWVSAYVAGDEFLVATNNLSDLADANVARVNLGIDGGSGVIQQGDLDPSLVLAGPSLGKNSIIRTNANNIIEDIVIAMHKNTFTGNSIYNTLSVGTQNGYCNGDTVYLSTTGTLPTGLEMKTRYYVVNVTLTTLQLATTFAGTPIDLLDRGDGVHTLYKGINGSSAGHVTIEDGFCVTIPHGSSYTIV